MLPFLVTLADVLLALGVSKLLHVPYETVLLVLMLSSINAIPRTR
jgi:hypothetical protein